MTDAFKASYSVLKGGSGLDAVRKDGRAYKLQASISPATDS